MSIEQLAKNINNEFDNGNLHFAYGLLKETLIIWRSEDNKKLLNDNATVVLEVAF